MFGRKVFKVGLGHTIDCLVFYKAWYKCCELVLFQKDKNLEAYIGKEIHKLMVDIDGMTGLTFRDVKIQSAEDIPSPWSDRKYRKYIMTEGSPPRECTREDGKYYLVESVSSQKNESNQPQ